MVYYKQQPIIFLIISIINFANSKVIQLSQKCRLAINIRQKNLNRGTFIKTFPLNKIENKSYEKDVKEQPKIVNSKTSENLRKRYCETILDGKVR